MPVEMTDRQTTAADDGGPRLGLSTGALYPTPTEDAPEIAARHGLFDLEILLQTRSEYEPPFIRLLGRRCRDAGSRVHAVHVWQQHHPLFASYPRRVADARDLFDQAIAGAAELGARVVVWHGACRDDLPGPNAPERALAVIAERGRACAAAGLTLGLENVSWCMLRSVRDVTAMAARLPELRAGGAAVGFVFDPFQAVEADANPFMTLAAMGNAVVDAHLSDRRASDAARHLPPGEGDLAWPALLRAISGAYRGPLMLEGVVGADVARLDAARALLEPMLAAIARDDQNPCAAAPPPGLREGIRLFNAGEFYEAHEAIEPEWHAERRPIRRLYQGILQIGVGFLHARRGNHAGALLLLADGIEKSADFTPACLGIDVARLVRESQACLDHLRALGPARLAEFDQTSVPRVWFVDEAARR
jgi:sugar phosphate isomerase/epimerase/predicted metal-dependent hydrolase